MKSVVLYNFQLFKQSEEKYQFSDLKRSVYETPLPNFHLNTWSSFPLSIGWLWSPFLFPFYPTSFACDFCLIYSAHLLSFIVFFASLYFPGRNNIFPTLFLLWRCPHAIRTFVIHAPVSGQDHSQQLLCFFSSVKLVTFYHYHDSLWNHFTLSLMIWFQRVDHIFSYDLTSESAI